MAAALASDTPSSLLRAALANVGEAVLVIDRHGIVVYMNPLAVELTETPWDEGVPLPLAQVFDARDEATGEPLDLDLTPDAAERQGFGRAALVGREGRETAIEGRLIGLDGPGGFVLSFRDAGARQQLERQLRARDEELAAAERRREEFLALLAHELRNPLAPITNALELMRQDEASWKGSREIVARQVKHLTRLVDDLLDVSRLTHGNIHLRRSQLDLAELVEHAVEASRPHIAERGHELSVELPPQPVRLLADGTRIEQVLTNLLNNAAAYTPPGGRIWLVAEQSGDRAVIRVRDTGIGLPLDARERLFTPFTLPDAALDRAEGGLGVGLALARRLVEMHGGTLAATSEGPGQGSEFTVTLPGAQPGPPAAALSPAAASGRPARPLAVLVVDDNRDAAQTMAILLEMWGHRPVVAHDGPAALESVARERPDVVLLDIGMPGMDGYEVARRLRDADAADLLLVAVTGYGQQEDLRRSQEAGFDRHLVKPVEPSDLRALLAGAAARPRPGPPR